MNLVVADTSPLNYLVLIDAVHVLPRLYGKVVIPAEVVFELAAGGCRHAPAATDPALSHLDVGDRSAILLAQSEPNVILLIDEAAGRLEASRRGIRNTGTPGVLRSAAMKFWLKMRREESNRRESRPLRTPWKTPLRHFTEKRCWSRAPAAASGWPPRWPSDRGARTS